MIQQLVHFFQAAGQVRKSKKIISGALSKKMYTKYELFDIFMFKIVKSWMNEPILVQTCIN